MPVAVTPAIPASVLVNVIPSVLSAGGTALDMVGIILTNNTKPPIGQVLSFGNANDVEDFFGPMTQESALADIYFLGPNNKTASPGVILFAQYPSAPVAGYLRGASMAGVSLTTLQGFNALISVVIDAGSAITGTINLATATSFSNAAEIIGGALAIKGPEVAVIASADINAFVMTVHSMTSGVLSVGDIVIGTGIPTNTYIASFGTGFGGAGTYNLSASSTTETGEAIQAYAPGIYFDSQLKSFVIQSGTTGADSSVAFATGQLAIDLKLNSGSGAIVSAGAATGTPAAFMDNITDLTQNWASFMTAFEPDDADKQAFATWTNSRNNRYVYEMWDTSTANTASGGPSPAVAFINASQLSGVDMIYQNNNIVITNGEKAAFQMGWTASLDFTRTNGRATAAFKGQSGLLPEVITQTIADYLISYGMNFYGDYTTANEAFLLWQPGQVSGEFLWKDSYVNQIWLNNQLQLSIMVGLSAIPSLPYNAVGYALIESFCMDPINAAVNFGAIRSGVPLSAEQIAIVNQQAGAVIDTILTQRGWYLQVKPATAQVRAARTSPPCTLWYTDGGSIQQIVLASIEIQ